MAQFISLCDHTGHVVGFAEKLYAHQMNLLHLAFSVMLYRKTPQGLEVLLQKRSNKKYHAPSLWANTCCSHPQNRKLLLNQAARRLDDELKLSISASSLKLVDSFIYQEKIDSKLTEYEFDFLLIGAYEQTSLPALNPDEVSQVQWVRWQSLKEEDLNYNNYAPWLKHVVRALKPTLDKIESNNSSFFHLSGSARL